MNSLDLYKFWAKIGFYLKDKNLTNRNTFSNVLESNQANAFIREGILSKKPFMVSRFGNNEYQSVNSYLEIFKTNNSNFAEKLKLIFQGNVFYWNDELKTAMERNAGFFPASDALLTKFSKQAISDSSLIDLIGFWGELKNESNYYRTYCPKAKLTELPNLEPYYHLKPWSLALEGKKVLVVHPFEMSIKKNYAFRELLFPFDVLPEFELKTLKSVQSIANNKSGFQTWFDALDAMCDNISGIDFDVMIVGAGAYGMSLAAHAKRMGKQSIHLGGATQILFGIKGKRWETNEKISSFFNDNWTRPMKIEVPLGYHQIENGCYW